VLIDSTPAAGFTLFALCGAKFAARRQRTLTVGPAFRRRPDSDKEIVMWIQRSLVPVLLASACGLAGAATPRIEYRVTRVAPLISEGTAINNAGASVGAFQFSGSGAHAFLSRGSSSIDLGALGSFNNLSIANDINDSFQVVGTSDVAGGTRGFIYAHGALRDVNVFLPANTTATGINNAGYIVGAYQLNGAPSRGYLRAPDGSFRDIGTLPYPNPFTLPEAINRHGQIVGGSGPSTPSGLVPRAFLVDGGVMRNLGNLGANPSVARDINDAAQVTGYSSLGTPGVFHAFLWQKGRLLDIDGRRGVGQSVGTGINKRGHIVGNSDHLGPFIYRGKKMESLNALIDPAGRYIIRDVQGINDKGQIIGRADQEGVAFGFAVRLDPCTVHADGAADADADADADEHAE
jgi:probable HAF family extracellular repeat protein